MTTTTLATTDSRVHPQGVAWRRRVWGRPPCRRVRPIRAATRGAPCRPLAPRLAIFSVPQGDSEAKNAGQRLDSPTASESNKLTRGGRWCAEIPRNRAAAAVGRSDWFGAPTHQ